MKTELLEDQCDLVQNVTSPSKVVRVSTVTSESEMEIAGDMKTEDESALRTSDGPWITRPASGSKRPPVSMTLEEQSKIKRRASIGC